MTNADLNPDVTRFARGGLLSVAGAGVGSIAGIALVAVVTNGFSQGQAGTLFATTALFLMVATLTQLGTEIGLVRWFPALIVARRLHDVVPALRTALIPLLVVSTTAGIAMILTAGPVAEVLVGNQQAADATVMLRCLGVFVPINAAYTAILAATRGLGTMRTTVFVDSIGRCVAQPVAVFVVAVAGGGALALVLAWVSPFLVCLAIACVSLRGQLRAVHAPASADPEGTPEAVARRVVRGEFWGFTGPRAIATVAQVTLKRLDIVLVSALRSPEEAAIYTAATRFVVLGQLTVQALQQALGPQLSGLLAQGKMESAKQVFQTATSWMMLVAWPIYLVSAVLAPWLLRFFGAGYSAGSEVVVILSLSMLVATASGSVDTVLLMSGRSWLSLANNVAALLINVVLNLILIPAFGINGAAVAWAAAIVVRNLLPLIQIRLLLGVGPGSPATVWVAGTALGIFGLLPLIATRLGAPDGLVAAIVAAVCCPLYAALMFRKREVLALTDLWPSIRGKLLGQRGKPRDGRSAGAGVSP